MWEYSSLYCIVTWLVFIIYGIDLGSVEFVSELTPAQPVSEGGQS